MALVSCPECGKEVSDKAATCPNCGFGIAEHYRSLRETEEEEKRKIDDELRAAKEREEKLRNKEIRNAAVKRNIKWIILICAVCFGLLALAIIFIPPEIEYKKAIQALETGDYLYAFDYFSESKRDDAESRKEVALEGLIENEIDKGNIENAYSFLDAVSDNEKKTKYTDKILIKQANQAYNMGAFLNTIQYLNATSDKGAGFEELRNRATIMNHLQGMWVLHGSLNKGGTIFDYDRDVKFAAFYICGWDAKYYHCIDNEKQFIKDAEGKLVYEDKDRLKFSNNGISFTGISEQKSFLVAKMQSDAHLEKFGDNLFYQGGAIFNYFGERDELAFRPEKFNVFEEPAIGMSKSDLQNSTWGEPKSINTDTYAWGTHEQWVYSGDRYIYLENDIVTAIQEHNQVAN